MNPLYERVHPCEHENPAIEGADTIGPLEVIVNVDRKADEERVAKVR
jgi:hypothetical protein